MSAFESAWSSRSAALIAQLGDAATWYHGGISEPITVIFDEELAPIPAGDVDVWGREIRVLTTATIRPRDQIKLDAVVYTVGDVLAFGDLYEGVLER